MGYGMNEETGDDGAFFTLEANLFESAHGEGMEIVSIKSNRNQVRANTFLRSKGGITNRSGNFNVIEGNVILGEREPRSYGIRVTGQQHRVANNYVADVDGAGLLLVAGEYIQRALSEAWQPLLREGTLLGRVPRYAQVRRASFEHNTFVNCAGGGIEIGSSYKAGWPEAQRVLLPEDNRFVGNLVLQPGALRTLFAPEPDQQPPLDAFRFWPNVFEENAVVGLPPSGVTSPGIETIALALPERGASASPVVQRDDSAASRRPLRPEQVGPSWLKER
jgi:poly(beta-D-mannuronate) lyase